MDIIEYAQKVHAMRKAQSNFFQAAKRGNLEEKKHWLPISKNLEKEVDELTEQFLPTEQAPTQQASLF